MTLRFRRRRFETAQVVIEAVLTAYHGTRNGGFDDFKSHYRKGEQLGFGIHFSADREFAARYAHDDEVARKGKAPMVYTVQLTMDRPLKADEIVSEGSPEFALAKKLAGAKLYVSKDEHGTPCCYMQNAIDSTSPQRAEKLICAAGFDGVIYRAKVGSRAVGGMVVSGESESYIVFEPSQIRIVSKESLAEAESQTSTPEFQRWFEQSKVVDVEGNPLRVYHGSNADFAEFDPGTLGKASDFGFAGKGFYFMDDPEWASGYAEVAHSDHGGEPVVYAVYLSLQNPLEVDNYDAFEGIPRDHDAAQKIQDDLVAQGYDGIIVRGKAGNPTEYVAFRPNQIKSATGNSGNFDPTSSSLIDSVEEAAPTDSAEFKSWFKNSQVVDSSGNPERVYHVTVYGDFGVFDKSQQRKGMAGYGFYFTDVEGVNIYADYGKNFQADQDWKGNPKRINIMPVYLSIQNPLVIDNIADAKAKYGNRDPGQFGQSREYGGMSKDALTAVERAGYDGVISTEYVKRMKDGSYKVVEPGTKGAIAHPIYVVFNSTQIKSAIGNSGKYDPDSDDIVEAAREVYAQIEREVSGVVSLKFRRLREANQTDTPEFKRWFDKSKVVDSNGKPLIVYHGTKKDFSTFDSGRFGTFDHGTVGIGIYATSNKEIANNYTHTVVGNVRVHDGGNVMPMYMRIVNPIGFDDAMKIKMQLVNDLIASGESWAEVEKSIGRRLTAHLKELGYDGVSPTDGKWEGVGDSWTAFSPAQVKSAIGNSGSFDPASNKITDAVHADIDATIRHLS